MDRVFEDVADGSLEVRLAVDRPGGESLLEDMSPSTVSPVEGLRVDAVQPVHSVRDSVAWSLDEQVVVRAKQAPGVASPTETVDYPREQAAEPFTIAIVCEDHEAAHAAGGEMEDADRIE